jgi:hypothetical protein
MSGLTIDDCKAACSDESTLESVAKKIFEHLNSDGKVEVEKLKEFLDNFFEENDISAPSSKEIEDYKKDEGMKADDDLDFNDLKTQVHIFFKCAQSLERF